MGGMHIGIDVVLLLSMNCLNAKNQSLWRPNGKGYAKAGTFFVSSVTSIAVRFTLVEFIGSLNPSEVTLITFLTCVKAASSNQNQMERYGNETVTISCELFLDNPCNASKESVHETTENGCFGVNNTMSSHSTRDLMAQYTSHAVLGARLLPLSGSMGRNIMGAKQAPSELVRTGGALLCRPSPRGVVKAIPEIRIVEWVPAASFADVHMETGSLGADFRGGSMPNDEDRSAPECCGDIQGLTHLV